MILLCSFLLHAGTTGVYPYVSITRRKRKREADSRWASPKNGRFSMFSSLEDIDGPPHPVPFRFLSPGDLPPCRIKLLASRVKSLIGVFIEKRLRRDLSFPPSGRREPRASNIFDRVSRCVPRWRSKGRA